MERFFFITGSFLAGLAVVLGAFGAHALRDRLSEDLLTIFETGVRYQMYHALALLVVALAFARWPGSTLLHASGWLFFTGVIIFSGSLYILAMTGIRWLGAITPLGGAAFIAGWVCLLLAAWRGT